jgi:hypothetical protein
MRIETESKPSKKRGRSWSICNESSCAVAEGFRVVDSQPGSYWLARWLSTDKGAYVDWYFHLPMADKPEASA